MRSSQHIGGVLSSETYVIIEPVVRTVSTKLAGYGERHLGMMVLIRLVSSVKYHAYLRKMTRYNPTRGGTFSFRHR